MPEARTTPSTAPWLRLAGRRVVRFIWLKALGTPLFMMGFFVAYFVILRNPLSPPFEVPLTAADRWIGFQPAALLPYASLWIYVILPSALMVRFRELLGHTLGAAGLSLAGLLAFILWPTVTPPADIDWTAHPQMQFLKSIDASGNACPSLHAAFAVFTACWLARLLRRLDASPFAHVLNVLWAVLIVYSTLATRQHVALDALSGALLGWFVAGINLRLCAEPSESSDLRAKGPAR